MDRVRIVCSCWKGFVSSASAADSSDWRWVSWFWVSVRRDSRDLKKFSRRVRFPVVLSDRVIW